MIPMKASSISSKRNVTSKLALVVYPLGALEMLKEHTQSLFSDPLYAEMLPLELLSK